MHDRPDDFLAHMLLGELASLARTWRARLASRTRRGSGLAACRLPSVPRLCARWRRPCAARARAQDPMPRSPVLGLAGTSMARMAVRLSIRLAPHGDRLATEALS